MVKHVLHTYGINLWVAEALVKDLTDEQMSIQPNGLVNHPCWSLGHLAVSGHRLCELIGIENSLPNGWGERFKAGTPPSLDSVSNPSKNQLIAVHRQLHEKVADAFSKIDSAALDRPHPVEDRRKVFPTVGDQVIFMLTAHEMDHLGQMAAWRRAMGLKPAI